MNKFADRIAELKESLYNEGVQLKSIYIRPEDKKKLDKEKSLHDFEEYTSVYGVCLHSKGGLCEHILKNYTFIECVECGRFPLKDEKSDEWYCPVHGNEFVFCFAIARSTRV